MLRADDISPLVRRVLEGRGIAGDQAIAAFLNPDYDRTNHDPMLLPDMRAAAERLLAAADRDERVVVYCDYDVDGTCAAAILLDALPKFGINNLTYYVPDRFAEGYGMNIAALDQIKADGADLVLTVDNGIVSFDEAEHAKSIGLDLVITDHHSPREELPKALAVVNPKISAHNNADCYDSNFVLRSSDANLYPFCDLCGSGVAFKLVRALQKLRPNCLPVGQEKWLLDLTAIATVSDVVSLVDENRSIVYWGLKVLHKTRRPGLRALVKAAGLDISRITSRDIGFMIGPRINAAGRLSSARLAVDLLTATDVDQARELAERLNALNEQRKALQNSIFEEAIMTIDDDQPVAIACGDSWHEGVIGIVASKVQERLERPAFVFTRTEDGRSYKASGRSFGEFSIAGAIAATSSLLKKGGGHAAAGGVTVSVDNFSAWCQAVNEYYRSLNLTDQEGFLYPDPDVDGVGLDSINIDAVRQLEALEPFGAANSVPVFRVREMIIGSRRLMGANQNHVKYKFITDAGDSIEAISFGGADRFTVEPSRNEQPIRVDVLMELSINEWNGNQRVQGRLLQISA